MSQDQQPNLLDEVVFPDLHFTADDLEGVDFNAIPDPDVSPWLKDIFEADAPLDAGQSSGQPPPTQNQSRRSGSVVTFRRSSCAGSTNSRLSITVQDENGRQSSKEIPWDPAWDDFLQDLLAENTTKQQAPALQPQSQRPVAPVGALPPATLPTAMNAPQLEGLSALSDLLEHQTLPPGLNALEPPSLSEVLALQPVHLPVADAPAAPLPSDLLQYQPLPRPRQPPTPPTPIDPLLYRTAPTAPSAQQYGMPAAPRGRTPLNAHVVSGGQNLPLPQSRATAAPARQAPPRTRARARANPPSKRRLPRPDSSGRPPLPPGIAPFVNPHHIPRNHGRVPDKRGVKDTTIANDFYYSISHLPGLHLPYSGKTVSYSGVEFEPNLRFTATEFLEYLEHATQRPDNHRRPILRIQIQPAQSNHRYIRGGQSFKCRFQGCPDKRGTILKGQVRICIQEFDDESGEWLNPYHNAGHMHLYCLEQQVNLIELFRDPQVVVIPEDRKFDHEPPATTNPRANNPMALNDLEMGVVETWLEEIGARWDAFTASHPDPAARPPFLLNDKDHLFHRLTAAHLENPSTKIIQRKRKLKAGGKLTNHLDQFVGDVSKQVETHKRMRAQREQAQNAPAAVPEPDPAAEPPRKRTRQQGPSPAPRLQAQPYATEPAGPPHILDSYADGSAPYYYEHHLPQQDNHLTRQDSYLPQQNSYAPQQENFMPVGSSAEDYPLGPLAEGELAALPMPPLPAADQLPPVAVDPALLPETQVSTPRAGSHPGRRGSRTSRTQTAATPGPRAEHDGVRKSPRRRSPRIQAGKTKDSSSQTRRSSGADTSQGPPRRASAGSETDNSLEALLLDALEQDDDDDDAAAAAAAD